MEYHWSIEIGGGVEHLFHIVFKMLSLVVIYFLKAAEFSAVNGSAFPSIKSYTFTLKKVIHVRKNNQLNLTFKKVGKADLGKLNLIKKKCYRRVVRISNL